MLHALGKRILARTIGYDPLARSLDTHSMHAGSLQVPSFQLRRENFDLAHLGPLPHDEPSTPNLLLVLARCPSSISSRSDKAAGRGHRVCESAEIGIFRVLEDPRLAERKREKCSEEVRGGWKCVFMRTKTYWNRWGTLERTSY